MIFLRVLIAGVTVLWACHCSRPRPPEPVPLTPAVVRSPPQPAALAVSLGPDSADQSVAKQPPANSFEQFPPVCPADMLEVEGEYCTEVRQHCTKSWYGKANKKTICEVFEEPTRCTGQREPKHYCIDRFAWPNRKGQRPEVMNTFYQAQVKCAARGKRMCTESEWTLACEGPEMKPYPYGYVRDANKCNGDRPWDKPNMKKVGRRDAEELARLWQGVRSGSQPECISDYGVHDLPGNNDEVVASETFSPSRRARYDSVHTGGPWYLGVRNQCRPKIYSHDEGFYYYFLGFRCCGEPAPKVTDPRTPKQRKKRHSFGYVERLAGFSVETMKKKLDQIAEGSCRCTVRDRLCKTLCGTLLGENASDAVIDSKSLIPPPQ